MKIGLIGYGKMGRLVEEIALARGHSVEQIICRMDGLSEPSMVADIYIDFSHPSSVLQHVKEIAKCRKNMVIGTTGWYEAQDAVCEIVKEFDTGIVYGPNFSLGVNLLYHIASYAASLLKEYEVGVVEEHHLRKADSPSGTAKRLAEIIGAQDSIASLRCGSILGIHKMIFNSALDTIEITHTAHTRKGFAEGAVIAAEWIYNRKGLFTFEDMLLNSLGSQDRA